MAEAETDGVAFAALWFVDDARTAFVRDFRGAILRVVINNDDFELKTMMRQSLSRKTSND